MAVKITANKRRRVRHVWLSTSLWLLWMNTIRLWLQEGRLSFGRLSLIFVAAFLVLRAVVGIKAKQNPKTRKSPGEGFLSSIEFKIPILNGKTLFDLKIALEFICTVSARGKIHRECRVVRISQKVSDFIGAKPEAASRPDQIGPLTIQLFHVHQVHDTHIHR